MNKYRRTFSLIDQKAITSFARLFILTTLLIVQSCGVPAGGSCGDGVTCIEDPATSGVATEDDVLTGKVAYNELGELLTGKLSLSSLSSSKSLRVSTADASLVSTQKQDAENSLSNIYSFVPTISVANIHGDFTGITQVDPTAYSDCGTSQSTIAERIADCLDSNPSSSSWDGRINANSGEGTWTLVSKTSSDNFVWKDENTGLLWSDVISPAGSVYWCVASGNSAASTYCQPGAAQQPASPESLCYEDAALTTPASADDAKGGLNKDDHGVIWRLPTKGDLLQAELDGLRWIYLDFTVNSTTLWASTILGNDVGTSWTMNSRGEFSAPIGNISANATNSVMCVGSYSQEEE